MYLEQVASDDFVLLKAAWTVEQTQQVLVRTTSSHVIVHREEAGSDFYYLFRRAEAADRLVGQPSASTIGTALGLSESGATDTNDRYDSAETAPDATVVLDEGALYGFMDVSDFAPPRRTRGGGGGGRRTGGGGGGAPRTRGAPTRSVPPKPRALKTEFPDTVPLGKTAGLLVSLTAEGVVVEDPEREILIAVAVGSEVDIVVQAKQGFEIEGRSEGALSVTDEEETLPLRFELKAVAKGPGRIRVLAFQDGSPLGVLTIGSKVVEADGEMPAHSTREHRIEPTPVHQKPDLSLLILEQPIGGKPAIRFLLSASDPSLDLFNKPYGPVELEVDPQDYFADFFDGIEDLPLETDEHRQIAVLKLAAKGLGLFNSLFPEDLRERLWELRDDITTVQVVSDEPWIPWELCKLEGNENGDVVSGPFLAEAFAITRWIPGIGIKPSLTLRNFGLVVPSDSGLAFAPDEKDYVMSLANGGRNVTSVPARFIELYEEFTLGTYDAWHFTGHGLFSHEQRNRSGISLEGDTQFGPDMIEGEVKNLGNAAPLVFLNACQIGRSAFGLTDIGGFASQFLKAGAAAFIGSYWSVFDDAALEFAKVFYANLLAGETIGEASKAARTAINTGGDPTWLAYTVYADPLATVV